MKTTEKIIKGIKGISGKYSPVMVFSDWVQLMALAISNCTTWRHDAIWKKREDEYKAIIMKYDESEQSEMVGMMLLLEEAVEEKMTDVLGELYMKIDSGNSMTGQFFTPYHLSELCAKLAVEEPDEDGRYHIYEPSCGSGGMLIGAAKDLKEKGYNYQKVMKVVAQDLDWRCVHMCYVQMSMLGIDAEVVQGNTLAEPYKEAHPEERILRTPKNMRLII